MEEELCSFTEFDIPAAEDWKQQAIEALKGAPFDKKLIFQTDEGIPVQPIYNLDDYLKNELSEQFPGIKTFERGGRPTGYLKNTWHFSQALRIADPAEANERIREQLKGGQNCIHLEIDSSARKWDDPETEHLLPPESYQGLSLFCKEDLAKTLEDVPLDHTPLHLYAGENPVAALGLLAAVLYDKADQPKVHGIVAGDPLSEWIFNGLSLGDPSWQLDIIPALIRWARKHEQAIKTVLIRGDYYQDSGADSALEVAIILGLYTEYFRELMRREVSETDVASTIACSVGVGSNFFMEIAKIRSLRILLQKIQEAFGLSDSQQKVYVHGKVTLWDKTLYDPYVNLLRNTSQAFSAITGGVDSLEIPTYDTVYGSSNAFSERVSRNLHHILEKESRLTYPIDPAAGSWYIESLTESFCKKAWSLFQEIESKGGIREALIEGWVQKAVTASREKKDKNIRNRKRPFIGTTLFANRKEKKADFACQHEVSGSIDRYLQHVKNRTHFSLSKGVSESLQKGDPEAMEAIVQFFNEGGTIGALKRLLAPGADSTSIERLKPYRATEGFERIRERTEKWERLHGKAFPLYLINYGTVGQYKARADFSEGFFDVAGFQTERTPGFRSLEEALNGIEGLSAVPKESAALFILCSSDDLYPEIVPPLAKKIKTIFPKSQVILAGKPAPDQEQAYKNSGLDRWIYMGCDLADCFTSIQNEVMPDA